MRFHTVRTKLDGHGMERPFPNSGGSSLMPSLCATRASQFESGMQAADVEAAARLPLPPAVQPFIFQH